MTAYRIYRRGTVDDPALWLDPTTYVIDVDGDPLEAIFVRHNRDDRPDGRLAPSLSVDDVVAVDGRFWRVEPIGFDETAEPATVAARTWTEAWKGAEGPPLIH